MLIAYKIYKVESPAWSMRWHDGIRAIRDHYLGWSLGSNTMSLLKSSATQISVGKETQHGWNLRLLFSAIDMRSTVPGFGIWMPPKN